MPCAITPTWKTCHLLPTLLSSLETLLLAKLPPAQLSGSLGHPNPTTTLKWIHSGSQSNSKLPPETASQMI